MPGANVRRRGTGSPELPGLASSGARMAKRSRHAVSAGQDANLVRQGRCGMGRPASCLTRSSPVAQFFNLCLSIAAARGYPRALAGNSSRPDRSRRGHRRKTRPGGAGSVAARLRKPSACRNLRTPARPSLWLIRAQNYFSRGRSDSPHPLRRFAPPTGVIRLSGWGDSPHPPLLQGS